MSYKIAVLFITLIGLFPELAEGTKDLFTNKDVPVPLRGSSLWGQNTDSALASILSFVFLFCTLICLGCTLFIGGFGLIMVFNESTKTRGQELLNTSFYFLVGFAVSLILYWLVS